MRKRTYLTISCLFALLAQTAWASPEDSELAALKAELASAGSQKNEAQMELQNQALLDQEAALLKKISVDPSSDIPQGKTDNSLNESPKKEAVKPAASSDDDEMIDFGEPSSDAIQKAPEVKEAKLSNEGTAIEVTKLESDNSTLRRRLSSAESQLATLKRELDRVKDQRMLAETEVERLSRVLEERDRAGLLSSRIITQKESAPTTRAKLGSRSLSSSKSHEVAEAATPEKVATGSRSSALVTTRPVEDVQVATVVAPKAYLRTGPGTENSPLMAVTEGTKLVVETRRGGWYRVVSPTGTRAWVASSVLSFSPFAGQKDSDSTLKLKGVDSSLDASSRALAGNRL